MKVILSANRNEEIKKFMPLILKNYNKWISLVCWFRVNNSFKYHVFFINTEINGIKNLDELANGQIQKQLLTVDIIL